MVADSVKVIFIYHADVEPELNILRGHLCKFQPARSHFKSREIYNTGVVYPHERLYYLLKHHAIRHFAAQDFDVIFHRIAMHRAKSVTAGACTLAGRKCLAEYASLYLLVVKFNRFLES